MLSDKLGQASLFRQQLPEPQPSQPRARIQIEMREFLVSAIHRSSGEKPTGLRAFSRNFSQLGTQCREQTITVNAPSKALDSGRGVPRGLSLGSTPVPAGLHLGRAQPFDRLRDHPLMAVWIAEQATPVPVKVGFERLQHHQSGTDALCSESIRVRNEETKTNPGSQR